PHVEIEAAIVLMAGLEQRRLQRLEAGDATQAHVECGAADAVVAACRQRGETICGDTETRDLAGEGMETEHGGILRVVGDGRTRAGAVFGIGVASQRRRQGEGEEAVLGPAEEITSVTADLRAAVS